MATTTSYWIMLISEEDPQTSPEMMDFIMELEPHTWPDDDKCVRVHQLRVEGNAPSTYMCNCEVDLSPEGSRHSIVRLVREQNITEQIHDITPRILHASSGISCSLVRNHFNFILYFVVPTCPLEIAPSSSEHHCHISL
ncbi:hypothetical protein PIB30_067811 [Stylosanthes scabra]|uniref:Uncharacterized protein n=1 Tax=Stylosanthes scabra TaxID=79078 RepID=A0ABU6QMM3_9FABA|nr:hypothetical protein [Stylosanthes scabra]